MGNNNVNLHEGHRERMRKRFRETGFDGFEEHQIIEMLLFYVCPRKDTNELAHILINRFGCIAGILDASYDDLTSIPGISENTATLFKMIPKFLPVYYNSLNNSMVFDDSEKLISLFKPYFVGLDHEEFRLACFDNHLHLLSNILIATGSPSSAPFDMRKIVGEIFRTNASSIAIAHNHPQGIPNPSTEDVCATRTINRTLKNIDVFLLDHIIVGARSCSSVRMLGYMTIFD